MGYNMGIRGKMQNTDRGFDRVNQLMVAERSIFADIGVGGEIANLYKYLAFFKRFPILDMLCPKSGMRLGWSHYRVFLQVEDDEALRWYLDEAAAETWGVRVLQRNISSQYYERMLLSQSKEPVRAGMVKLTVDSDIAKYSMLRGNEQLFASKYRLCLLSEAELKAEIEAQKARFVEQHLK